MNYQQVEILLVEDSTADAEMTRRTLRKRGLVPGHTEGPVNFLLRAEAACPDLARDLVEIRHLYTALRYGPTPTERDLQRLKHAVNALRP